MSQPKTAARASIRRSQIEEVAQSRLASCPYPRIKRLKCEFNRGSLVIYGRVATFFEKQLAQEAVAHVDGVKQLVNGVEVV